MKKKTRVTTAVTPELGYPSLQEHLSTRRRFLGLAGASLAAGTLAAACNRAMGAGGDADAGPDPEPDATVPNDVSIEIGGIEPEPDYYTLRIPVSGSSSAWLIDGGYAAFHVSLVTYAADSYQALLDNLGEAENRCRTTLQDFTYDGLNSATGITGAEEDLLETLDLYCQELNSHTYPTIEALTLTLTELSPPAEIGGAAPEPSYP
ncbi:MAG: hypothetical protein ABI333_26360 [bacterium]